MSKRTSWTGADGDHLWSDADDWTFGAPEAGFDAGIGVGAHVISLHRPYGAAPDAVGTLFLSAGATQLEAGALDFLPTYQDHAPTYDLELTKGASLTVLANATLDGDEVIKLGGDGSKTSLVVIGRVKEDFAVDEGGVITVTEGGHWVVTQSGFAVGGGGALVVSDGGVVDEGANGVSEWAGQLDLGDDYGAGTATIEGPGSRLELTEIYIADGELGSLGGYSGRLTIENGGEVIDALAVIGLASDGYVTVSGKGSRWINTDHLAFGYIAPTDSSLTVVNYGEVDWGKGGFLLYDTLYLDGSAKLVGRQIFDGGDIFARAGHGDVTLSQSLGIEMNWLFQYRELAAVSAAKGVTLRLDGYIYGYSASILYAGAGHVDVEHANNNYGATEIYGATLEVGAAGALGRGEVSFVGGDHGASLEIDAGISLFNAIGGFGRADKIDIVGLGYVKGETDVWKAGASGMGGSLTISAGAERYMLHFADTFSADSFTFREDAAGGTIVKLS